MRTTTSKLALLALPAFALATVKLSDFAPRASGVTGACLTVYSYGISACSASDFSSQGGCSAGCIKALNAMTSPIQKACGDKPPSGQNIITVYLSGNGPQSLCGKAAGPAQSSSAAAVSSTTVAPTTSAPAPSTTQQTTVDSSTAPASSAVSTSSQPSSATTTTSVPESSTSGTSTTGLAYATTESSSTTDASTASTSSTASTATTGLVIDTSAPPTQTATSSHSSTSTSRGSSQTGTGDRSGGGSPFDTMSSGATTHAASLLAALAFTACSVMIFQ